jgi:integrase/recombinase XerD
MIITNKTIDKFRKHLINEERSENTVEKYIRDITAFMKWTGGKKLTKELILEYKSSLPKSYAPASINSILSSINKFLTYNELFGLRVKTLKIQKRIFSSPEKELTKSEYKRLLDAAQNKYNKQLYYLMQTICSAGIRVSELRFITVGAVKGGQAVINCKGKLRTVILPADLCRLLKSYIREKNIEHGCIFTGRNGKPLNRTSIWRSMKKLCKTANVSQSKVFPHNLRHLFARTYYSIQKDIVRLADILGHSSINTTRIYTIESGAVHRQQLQKLGLTQYMMT